MKTILVLLILMSTFKCLGQTEFRLGATVHPNYTIVQSKNKSQEEKVGPFLKNLGMNFGLAGNLLIKENVLFEVSSSLATNRIGRRLETPDPKGAMQTIDLRYKTLSWLNDFRVSVRVFTKPKPYYDVFLGLNGHWSRSTITSYSSSGGSSYFLSSTAIDVESGPEYFERFGVGANLKIRTEIKRFGKIDYGLSYSYVFPEFPQFGLETTVNNKTNKYLLSPQIHLVQFNFIYYFKIWK